MIDIKENIPLAPMTTMKVGGPAKYFVKATSADEIIDAVKYARDKQLPIFILGGGSNVIFSDDGFKGLAIKTQLCDFDVNDDGTVIAGAAVPLGKIVAAAGERGLGGFQWAAGIPGTIGGAVRGNAGAFGGETKDVISEITYVDANTGELKTISRTDCRFGYRDSIFKHNRDIIVSVKLKLIPNQNPEDLQKTACEHMLYRVQKHPMEYPSAGSVFKNIPVDQVPTNHLPQFEDSIKKDPQPVVPAAKIIAEAGLAGEKIGGAEVSSKHTNYIINKGDATAADVISLIDKIKTIVKQKFQIDLIPEPQIVE